MRELIHPGQLAGHKAVVVGAGKSGCAAARLLSALGASVSLLDTREPSGEVRAVAEGLGIELLIGRHTKTMFKGADLIVLSPGIRPSRLGKVLDGIPENKIIGEMELACWFVSAPIIAVTGTNGKTTTTQLIGEMLRAAGKKVFVGGNIGTPLSEYLLGGEAADVLVLEISSFQLSTCRTFKPHVGVLLNISPNHLDWHESMEEYVEAKLSMFGRQTDRDLAIFPLQMKDELEKREATKARRLYFIPSERFEAPHLPGRHNLANIEAAWHAARAFGVTEEQAAEAVRNFRLGPNRIEAVCEKNGVLFVNDTKATTIDAVAAALNTFDRPVRLLAGGVFKGGELGVLVPLMKEKVRSVCLYGGSREIFEEAWKGHVPLAYEKTLEEAVKRLWAEAEEGDVILLSPATSSFDQYDNYEARGEDFRRIAREIC